MELARSPRGQELHSHRTERPLSSRLVGPSPDGDDGRGHRESSHLTNQPPSQRRTWKVFAALVLVVGVAVSATITLAWYAYVSSLRRQAVATSLGNVRSILGSSLERDSDLLATVNAVVATHPQLTNASLEAILSRLDLSQNYPGSFAFAYVESVSSAGLSRFEAVAQRDPPLGVAATSSGPVTSSLNGQSGYCLTRLAAVEPLAWPRDHQELAVVLDLPLPFGALQLLRLVVRNSARFLGTDRRILSRVRRQPGQATSGYASHPRGAPRRYHPASDLHRYQPGLLRARMSH